MLAAFMDQSPTVFWALGNVLNQCFSSILLPGDIWQWLEIFLAVRTQWSATRV